MKTSSKQSGFSLIELMIVVAIIGILATIAVPNFKKFQARSRQSEAREELTGMFTAEKSFYAEWSQFYEDFRAIGYCPDGVLRYRHGFSSAGSVNTPGNYSGAGGLTASAAATVFNTGSSASMPNSCHGFSELTTTVATLPALTGSYVTTVQNNTQFNAAASGDIDGDTTTYDLWTIDQNKTLSNITSDL